MHTTLMLTFSGLTLIFLVGAVMFGCAAEGRKKSVWRTLVTLCVVFGLTVVSTIGACFYHIPENSGGDKDSKTLGRVIHMAFINGAKKVKLKDGRTVWDEFK